ncbi:FliH/SctL family protein [Diplocloster agilis]|uniref:Flagellar assembly protein n=1 Tax=Diplocloster agilis TaxID=2850323 RepID=A0A949K7C4_9FIRM|nr:FliH/SctL family protein [Diplocloster agilis]MBU9739296.1 flagellar assembly protein [Diplocloster agilis]
MRSLSKVLKSEQTVFDQYQVPLYQEPGIEKTDKEVRTDTEETGYALISKGKKQLLERTKRQAELSAAQILGDAYAQRDKIVNTASGEAARIKEQAYEEGWQEGLMKAAEQIGKLSSELAASIDELKESIAGQENELREQVTSLALKIAEKILCEKIAKDDGMNAMARAAVLSEKEKSPLTVLVAAKAVRQAEAIEQALAPVREKYETMIKVKTADLPLGTLRVETPDGLVDASVYVQLENLKQQLEMLEE